MPPVVNHWGVAEKAAAGVAIRHGNGTREAAAEGGDNRGPDGAVPRLALLRRPLIELLPFSFVLSSLLRCIASPVLGCRMLSDSSVSLGFVSNYELTARWSVAVAVCLGLLASVTLTDIE